MRRFLVEVVINAVILTVIVLSLGVISVGQPFPFGTTSAPIVLLQPALAQFQGVAYLALIASAVTLIVSFVVLLRLFLQPSGPDQDL
jgi:hypothetical protein